MNTKQQAFDLFEQKRKEFLEYCRWLAVREYKKKGNITIDDVREQVKIPEGVNGKVFGAVFNKDWEIVAYVKTTRQTSHGRKIGVWKYIGKIDSPVRKYDYNQLFLI